MNSNLHVHDVHKIWFVQEHWPWSKPYEMNCVSWACSLLLYQIWFVHEDIIFPLSAEIQIHRHTILVLSCIIHHL